jgi:hypothetical protein
MLPKRPDDRDWGVVHAPFNFSNGMRLTLLSLSLDLCRVEEEGRVVLGWGGMGVGGVGGWGGGGGGVGGFGGVGGGGVGGGGGGGRGDGWRGGGG